MPTDETWKHAIDAAAGFGPWWLLAAALLVAGIAIAWKAIPMWDRRKNREIDVQEEREVRKRDEMAARAEHDAENRAIAARSVDALNRTADAERAMAAALNAINEKFEVSASHSAHMGEQVEEIAHKVDDIHAVTVRRG